jgi:hypothetical protein
VFVSVFPEQGIYMSQYDYIMTIGKFELLPSHSESILIVSRCDDGNQFDASYVGPDVLPLRVNAYDYRNVL